jgi:hypothetical protein
VQDAAEKAGIFVVIIDAGRADRLAMRQGAVNNRRNARAGYRTAMIMQTADNHMHDEIDR